MPHVRAFSSESRGLSKRAYIILVNQYMFDIFPVEDFTPILSEFERVLRGGRRIVFVNMTKGEKGWIKSMKKYIS
jgi:ubiquinone/menaquinone biosynthesis C-methylase UbiE